MRVYQFRQFRIGHELILCHKLASLSSVLGNLFFFWAASKIAVLKTREIGVYQFLMPN
ncbi:hypothetical protein [Microcoleus sp. D2_18a_D3]|uniref:hypothetical protein n=1 Tax=Microcoleus sp. D2_18a_D3 TaxID=3055330 RepID=UPI002FCEC81A